MKFVVWKLALWLCVLACPCTAWAAAPLATATIVDGEVVLIRDATRMLLAEGVRLAKDDIVETTDMGRLVRIEFSDGLMLDLGPGTRVLLSPRLSGDKARAQSKAHLLSGSAKLTVSKGRPPAADVMSSPAFDVTGMVRSAVFVVLPTEAHAFAESGELVLRERAGAKAGAIHSLKGSEFFSQQGSEKSTITPRPTPAFIQRLPRPFVDALPSRAALFKDRDVVPKRLGDITYADVAGWIDADGLRAGFVTRWKALAQDAEFRKGLIANLRNHPEWDRTLFPEKYLPKPAASEAARYGTKP
ncbi:MAG: hypothetical protein H7Y33_07825 [Cytophagales bacterium]|nr:hypothetical protein [Rhizobacter sp.]